LGMIKKLLLVLAGCCGLQGCIPFPITYYEPTASVGVRINDTCDIGPAYTLKIKRGPVNVRIRGKSWGPEIEFHVPEGHTVELPNPTVIASSGTWQQTMPLRYYNPQTKREEEVPVGYLLVGEKIEYAIGTDPLIVLTHAVFEGHRDTYSVTLPEVKVNSQALALPAVSFTKRVTFGLAALNC
jgi:hypothetical protein